MTSYDITFCKGHALITTLDGMVLVTMTGMDGIIGKCFLDTFAVVLKAGKVFLI